MPSNPIGEMLGLATVENINGCLATIVFVGVTLLAVGILIGAWLF